MQSSAKISINISLAISIFNFILLFVVLKVDFSNSIIASFLIIIFSFILVRLSIIQFIKNRIKPIIKTIYEEEKIDESYYSLDEIEKDAKKLKRKRLLLMSKLQKQIDFKQEFLGNISHELKTPIFTTQGYLDILLDGGLKDDNINIAYLKKASNNLERLSSIVSDIDVIARIESNAIKLHKIDFFIDELILEVIENLELLADKNDVKVFLSNTDSQFKVKADKKRIKIVLINLITNSLKYGNEKGYTKIEIFRLVDKVLIRVSDNGIGIDKKQLPRVFERFYRIDSNRSRQEGGSGLGLAIVKHVIESHSQTVIVKSELAKGTTFEFTLDKA